MVDVGDFIHSQQKYEIQLAEIFDWTYHSDQTNGSSFDFTSSDGSKIEAKFDWDSIKTGNHYLEYGQSSSGIGGEVPSGFAISANEADYWVVVNEEFIRFFDISRLKGFIKKNRSSLRTTRTRTGVNNNKVEQYSLGFLIPFEILDKECFIKVKSQIQRQTDLS